MEKPIIWMGQSYKELCSLPEDVQDELGYALGVAQLGGIAESAKLMKGNLREVTEVVSDEGGNTFRAMYTVKMKGRVYVLDVFQKKSKSGIATPKADLDRIAQRLKDAKEHYRKNPP
jgi:phage-related protein